MRTSSLPYGDEPAGWPAVAARDETCSYNRKVRWTVVIPAKALPEAKSRLLPASADLTAHRRLVRAIRADTLAAARAAGGVARVLVVVDRPSDEFPDGAGQGGGTPVDVLVQVGPGLDHAVAEGAEHARLRWPDDGVAALVGDLPALRPDELADALTAARDLPTGVVADASGTGTTLLTATPGATLRPAFGIGSAARHGATATPITAGPGLRHDVDTAADLNAAAELGLGTSTSAVLADTVHACSP